MRVRLMAYGVGLIVLALAACTGSSSTYIAPPATAVSSGALALGATTSSQTVAAANGITGTLTYTSGTGTVTAASSASAPSGTTAVVPAALRRTSASATSTVVYYVTITSVAGATLSGLPAVTLLLSAPPVGTYQEAQYTGTTWANVTGVTSTLNTANTAVQFSAGTTPITIPANGSIYLAFYQGNYPQATPTPVATPQNVLADTGFESGVVAPYGSTVNSTGWTQCAVSTAASGSGALPHPFSAFTPTPATTPGASIATAGTTIPVGSGTPIPTQVTVPVNGGTHAAEFGGVFSTYNQSNYGYNGLCQTVTIPKTATLSMYIFGNGNETNKFFDFDVNVLTTSGTFLANLYDDAAADPVTATSSGDSSYRLITVSSSILQPFAGQTVQLFIGSWVSGTTGSTSGSTKFSGYYFVDDATLVGIVGP